MLPYPKLLVCIVQDSSLFPFKNLLVNISAFPVAAGKLPLPSLNLDVLFGQWTRTFILRFRASVTSLWERQTGDYKTVTLTGDMESSLLKANPSHAHELREVLSKKNLCNELIKNVSYQVCFEQLQGRDLQSILFIPFPSGFSLSLLQKNSSCFFPIWWATQKTRTLCVCL